MNARRSSQILSVLGATLVVVFVVVGCGDSDPAGTSNNGGDGWMDPGAAGRRSKTFSTNADFTGENTDMKGVGSDATGELRLDANVQSYTTPYIWVPNSMDNTIVQIDAGSAEPKILGTFALKSGAGEECSFPSRTTVDYDGNVWLACRGNKYLEDTGGKRPTEIDYKVMKVSKADGRVMHTVKVGLAPRAMALDKRGHLWVGCSLENSLWEIDGETGECLRGDGAGCAKPAIALRKSVFPYGAAVDSRQRLWVVNSVSETLAEIDTGTGEILGEYGPYPRKTCAEVGEDHLYGIAIDQLDDIWMGGWLCSDVVRVKGRPGLDQTTGKTFKSGQMIASYSPGGINSRGVAVDADGNIWVAFSDSGTASNISGATGEEQISLDMGNDAHPIGVGVDAAGNAWVVNSANHWTKDGDGSTAWDKGWVMRISGYDTSETSRLDIGRRPYTYSDMLGLALRAITGGGERQQGTWTATIDSRVDNPKWNSVQWKAEFPEGAGAELSVSFRCAKNKESLSTASWGAPMSKPGPVQCSTSGAQFGQVKVDIKASDKGQSPVIQFLKVDWDDKG